MAMARTAPLLTTAQPITPPLSPFYVQYSGLSASQHYMDAHALGISLQGVSRILRVSAHFALYKEYVSDARSSKVQILVSPPKRGSLWFELFTLFAPQYTLIQHMDAGVLWDMTSTLVQAVLFKNSGNNKLNERLMDSMDKQNELWAETVNKQGELWQKSMDNQTEAMKEIISLQSEQNSATQKQMLKTHRKTQKYMQNIAQELINSNQLSAAKAVSPVGVSCNRMRVGSEPHEDEENDEFSIDKATASRIRFAQDSEILPEDEYLIHLDGVSVRTGKCTFRIDEESRPHKGNITDPLLSRPNNLYTNALNAMKPLRVRAKLEMRKNKPYMYHISDTVED